MSDISENIFQAIDILVDKKLEAVKFDETITVTVVDDTDAEKGKYLVTNGDTKFIAYSTNEKYKNNDVVLVTIPQGNYDNLKIIIGKYVDNAETPMILEFPFDKIIDLTNNLLVINNSNSSVDMYANGQDYKWSVGEDLNTINSTWSATLPSVITGNTEDLFLQGYEVVGIRAQFSTWLGEYAVIEGNYGIALEITFLVIDDTTNGENRQFTKIITLDSDSFFGNVYSFDTYYTQEGVYDISAYSNYAIVGMELFPYQRDNFEGEFLYERDEISEDSELSMIPPNIFIKDPYLCLGMKSESFNKDTAKLVCDNLTYTKEGYDDEIPETISLRDLSNKKYISLQWVHKDDDTGEIKMLDLDNFPSGGYEVRWYRYKLGALSPDRFAGAHWKRFYGITENVAEDGEWIITDEADDVTTNQLFVEFLPNVNNEEEKIKVVILKEEEVIVATEPIVFTNSSLVLSSATIVDLGALAIRYDDDEKGHYFLYNRAGLANAEEHNEIRKLTAVFDPNESDINNKADLTNYTTIKWTFPTGNTMILPMDYNGTNATQSNEFVFTEGINVYYTIKLTLVHLYTNNTVKLEVVKDGITYTAVVQMLFGTAGTSGSDYTLFVEWIRDNKNPYGNAIDLSDGASHELKGNIYLMDLEGNLVDIPEDSHIEADWYVAEYGLNTLKSKEEETADIYYPVFKTINSALNANLSNNPDSDYQNGEYYYFIDDEDGEDYYTFDMADSSLTRKTFIPAEYNSNKSLYRKRRYYKTEDILVDGSKKYYIFENGDYQIVKSPVDENLSNYYEREIKYKLEFRPVTISFKYISAAGTAFNNNLSYYTYNSNNNVYNPVDNPVSTAINNYYIKAPYDESSGITTSIDPLEVLNNEKKYYYSTTKRYFIKIDDKYILDPWQEYQEVETYYEPIEAKEVKYNPSGGIVATPNNNLISLVADSNLSMDSIWVLRLTLKNFGDYPLVALFPIALKNSYGNANTSINYIDGPTFVRYSCDGETDFNKNPYSINTQGFYTSLPSDTILSDSIDYYELINNVYTKIEDKENYEYDSNKGLYILGLSGSWRIICPADDSSIVTNTDILDDNFLPYLEIDNNTQQVLLSPPSVYIPEYRPYAVLFIDSNSHPIWTQSILIYEDNYPSTTLNKWNGKDIVTDEEAGTITANGFSAGKKERDNTFTGVVIGDWSRSDIDTAVAKNTGIYGFNHGSMSYAFKDDGTGFIGKDGKGRIYLDGDKSLIFSSNWANSTTTLGMLLDIDDGYIKMLKKSSIEYVELNNNIARGRFLQNGRGYLKPFYQGKIWYDEVGSELNIIIKKLVGSEETYDSTKTYYEGSDSEDRYITLGANQETYPFSIGTNKSILQRKFRIKWDGTTYITDGHFEGTITGSSVETTYLSADNGLIGGWNITDGTLLGGDTILNSSDGILTNCIQISKTIGGNTYEGKMGHFTGTQGIWNGSGYDITTTHLIGFLSPNSIVLETSTSGNIRLSSSDSLNRKCAGIYLYSDKVEFTAPATAQFGIYARFA